MKISIGENLLGSFFETTKKFNKIDEVNNAEEIIRTRIVYLKHGQKWFS